MTDETRTITVTLDKTYWARIDRLITAHPYQDSLDEFTTVLFDHVQQGIYRSGAWERDWLEMCCDHDAIEEAYQAEEDPLNYWENNDE